MGKILLEKKPVVPSFIHTCMHGGLIQQSGLWKEVYLYWQQRLPVSRIAKSHVGGCGRLPFMPLSSAPPMTTCGYGKRMCKSERRPSTPQSDKLCYSWALLPTCARMGAGMAQVFPISALTVRPLPHSTTLRRAHSRAMRRAMMRSRHPSLTLKSASSMKA